MISFSQVQFISIVKRKANNSTSEQQNCKGQEKRDRLLILKMEMNYQITGEIQVFPIDPFSQIGLILT